MNMKFPRFCIVPLLLLSCVPLCAQWRSMSVDLLPGYNSLWLDIAPSQSQSIDAFLAGRTDIDEIWCWLPGNPSSHFVENPESPLTSVEDWAVWRRGDPANSTLNYWLGNYAYLIKVADSATSGAQLVFTGQPLMPHYEWKSSGLNFFGFPVASDSITWEQFLAPSPDLMAATIYRYVGGPLGPGNPVQVFNKRAEKLAPHQAYWIQSGQSSAFYGPLQVSVVGTTSGLDFGTTGTTRTLLIRNISTNPCSVTLREVASAPAPDGESPVAASVPLRTQRFDGETGAWVYEALPASGYAISVPANSSTQIRIAAQRGLMDDPAGSVYQSLLEVTDDNATVRMFVPVSATVDSRAGLWVGDATVNRVSNSRMYNADGNPVMEGTSQTFPLRLLLHIDATDQIRLLPEVFYGVLASSGATGLCLSESEIASAHLPSAVRLSAVNLPASYAVQPEAFGEEVVFTVDIPFDDPHNPFLHTYHPDHDNFRQGSPLPENVESWSLIRQITLRFDLSGAMLGGGNPAWGTTLLGGTYDETLQIRGDVIDGNTQPWSRDVRATGIFMLRRLTNIDSIHVQ